MGLILGIIAIVVTLAGVVLIVFANGMSDAPSQSGISIWPWFLGGVAVSALLIGTHYFHISW